jgi:hypothetical protein
MNLGISTVRDSGITPDQIKKIVCNYYQIPLSLIESKTRKGEVVQARHVIMFFVKSLTRKSLETIGSDIGGRDHATVLHSCKTVTNLYDYDKMYRREINEIAAILEKEIEATAREFARRAKLEKELPLNYCLMQACGEKTLTPEI